VSDFELNRWLGMKDSHKSEVFSELTRYIPLPAAAVEKDWWVTQTLRLIFQMDCAPFLVFKGGTSLSKAWGLIERFSEDIDIALDRSFLGFTGEMTISQVKKLRKESFSFFSKSFFPEVRSRFREAGLGEADLRLAEVSGADQDPLIIEIYYPAITSSNEYTDTE